VKKTPVGKVRITKPPAMIAKMAKSRSGLNSIMFFIRSEASATPMVDTTVVFLVRAISVLPSGATAPRKAWGRIT